MQLNRIHTHSIARQQGAVLAVVLMFLLLLTILGISALNTTTLEERMAGNMKDRQTAFQAAETALITAENWINGLTNKPIFPDNSIGLYQPSTSDTPNWDSVDWSSNNVVTYPNVPGASGSAAALSYVNTQPKYIIEDMGEVPEQGGSLTIPQSYQGKGNTYVRITARGTGGTDATIVMVQSTFARPF